MNITNKSLGLISSVFAITMASTNPVAACDWFCCDDSDGGYSGDKNTSIQSENSLLLSSTHKSIQEQLSGLSTSSTTPIKGVETEKRKSEEEKYIPNPVVTEHKEDHTPTDQNSKSTAPNSNSIVVQEIFKAGTYYDSYSDTEESSEAQTLSKHQEAIVNLDLKDQVSSQIWNHLAEEDKPLSRSLLDAIKEVDLSLLESKSVVISIGLLSSDKFKLKIGSTTTKFYAY